MGENTFLFFGILVGKGKHLSFGISSFLFHWLVALIGLGNILQPVKPANEKGC
jgi:cytochrome b561